MLLLYFPLQQQHHHTTFESTNDNSGVIEDNYRFYDFSTVNNMLLKRAKIFLELDVPKNWKRMHFSLTLRNMLKKSLFSKPIFTTKDICLIQNLVITHRTGLINIKKALLANKRVPILRTLWIERPDVSNQTYCVGECEMKIRLI